MNILIAPNSFKESLSSHEITDIITQSLSSFSNKFQTIPLPLADGGSGFLEVMTQALHGKYVKVRVFGPLGTRLHARYGMCQKQKAAVLELAQAAGLNRIPPRKRNPLRTSTIGVGHLIRAAIREGARTILLGIGDSATIDCGIGALAALGIRFLDADGAEIPLNCRGLLKLQHIDRSHMMEALHKAKITVAADVDNTLTGQNGALMYARQKGATPRMLPIINKALRRFKKVVYATTKTDLDAIPGSGAAGGIGGAFSALLNASLVNGFSLVRKTVHLDRYMKQADCVITGEGMIDHKSRYGKTALQVLEIARTNKKPVILVVADTADTTSTYTDYGVVRIFALTDRHTKKYAMTHARHVLHGMAPRIAQYLDTRVQ
ncbi:MAG: glycerate kinase [candidate division WOR-3 bacterium]|nr:MAG: glycerate kinase [candidate division WOR-3 bacterium]